MERAGEARIVDTIALQLDQNLGLTVGSRTIADPVAGEVAIDVEWAGVCGSDLHVLSSGEWVEYWPATLGHEVAGVISESDSPAWPVGSRVIVDSRMPELAENGTQSFDRLSPNLRWLGEARPGGFAQKLVISAQSLHAVPDELPLDSAVLAEPLAVVMCGFDQILTPEPASVHLLGHGPIGMLAHLEARRRWPGATITVAEPNDSRAALAAELGASVVDAESATGSDLVIDAAGFAGSLSMSLDAVRRGGEVLMLALAHTPTEIVPADIVEHSVTITGSVGFDTPHLDSALSALADSPSDFRRLVTSRIPLRQAVDFLRGEQRSSNMKVLIDCRRS
jgi:threonine dehydrogenase-like Zn-dependent dehydrogenase